MLCGFFYCGNSNQILKFFNVSHPKQMLHIMSVFNGAIGMSTIIIRTHNMNLKYLGELPYLISFSDIT